MITELRISTCHAGRMPEFLQRYEAQGLALQARHCGPLLACYTSETGVLNQVVQMWAYADAADRDARLAALHADTAWRAFMDAVYPCVQQQETRLLRPTGFSPATPAGGRA